MLLFTGTHPSFFFWLVTYSACTFILTLSLIHSLLFLHTAFAIALNIATYRCPKFWCLIIRWVVLQWTVSYISFVLLLSWILLVVYWVYRFTAIVKKSSACLLKMFVHHLVPHLDCSVCCVPRTPLANQICIRCHNVLLVQNILYFVTVTFLQTSKWRCLSSTCMTSVTSCIVPQSWSVFSVCQVLFIYMPSSN